MFLCNNQSLVKDEFIFNLPRGANLKSVSDEEKLFEMSKEEPSFESSDYEDEVEPEDTREELFEMSKEEPSFESNDYEDDVEPEDTREDVSVKDISEKAKTTYNKAKDILDKEQICCFKESELRRFNGKSWEYLSEKEGINLVFSYMTDDEKNAYTNPDIFCRNVFTYIRRLCIEIYNYAPRFRDEDISKVQNRVVFQNGVYDILNDKLLEFDSDLPYTFEINADYLAENIATPAYDKLTYNATYNDKDSKKMLDQWLAYMLIPNKSGKAIGVCASARDSGKNVYCEFIMSLYADEDAVKVIDPDKISGRFVFGDIQNKRMLVCTDMSADRISKQTVAKFKQISGDKYIRCEQKRVPESTEEVTFKLLLCTNSGIYLPLGEESGSFYRRIIVLPFVKSTPLAEIDDSLKSKLQGEKSAIVSKCVRKLRSLIDKETGGIVFKESELSKKIKKNWMDTAYSDCAEQFIDENIMFSTDEKEAIPKKEIYARYEEYHANMSETKENLLLISSKELINLIKKKFPATEDKPLRRQINERGQKVKTPCLARLKWIK